MTTLSAIPENFLTELKNLREEVDQLKDQLRRTGSGDMADEAITSPLIAPDNVNETHILVPDLGTVNSDLGNITAGTITGAVHRTSATDPKVQLDGTGVFATDADGSIIIHVRNDGSIISGKQSFRATEVVTTSSTYAGISGTDITLPVDQNGFFSLYVEAELQNDNLDETSLAVYEITGLDGLNAAYWSAGNDLLSHTDVYKRITSTYWLAFRATSATGPRTWRAIIRNSDNASTARARNIRIYAKTT